MPRSLDTTVSVDAAGRSWGRVASEVAQHLRGKRRADFAPNRMPQVLVTVQNLQQVTITLRDRAKRYHHFSGYPGGLKTTRFGDWFDRDPEGLFRHTVRGMIPSNRLRDRILKHLKFPPA